MGTQPDSGEVVFFNKEGVLVTNKRLSLPGAVYRMSDIQRIETVVQRQVSPTVQLIIGIALLVLAGIAYFGLHLSDFGGFVCSIPGGFLLLLYIVFGRPYETILIGHGPSGRIVIGRIQWPDDERCLGLRPMNDEERKQVHVLIEEMEALKDAIGKALAYSTTAQSLQQQEVLDCDVSQEVRADAIPPVISGDGKVIVPCKYCGQKLRFSIPKGPVKVKCGACKHEFSYQ